MKYYFIRRFLLIPPTLLGITIIVFFITRIVPGGPLERTLMEAQMMSQNQSGNAQANNNFALSEDQLNQLKEYYGFDKPWYTSYFIWLKKIFTGDLGSSYRYNETVLSLIAERIPISCYYGIMSMIIIYSICIPLGIIKAIKHRTWIDNFTSILVFIGYAIPNYVLGSLLIVFLAAKYDLFPLGGFVSAEFEDLTFWGKVSDILSHSALPLVCYLIGSFAFLTLLMKNNLMENLSADYMRTAIAKGSSYKRAVLRHAFRNSLIPIASNFGQNIMFIVSGSFLIETIFDINGFGLLGYTSIIDRDYPVVMGVLLISSILLLIGNIISDILVAIIDPRIHFK